MPSTEIISHNGEECSGKMKDIHDGGERVRFDALTPALSHRERGERQPFRRIAMREEKILSPYCDEAENNPFTALR